MSEEDYRVLCVDDDESTLLLLKRIIEKDKYTVEIANSAQEACKIFDKCRPHLIVTDLMMPVIDGLTMIEKCRHMGSDADFIVLTGHGAIESAIKAIKMGVFDYILKPLTEPDVLRFAIRKAYDRRRLIDENLALKSEFEKDMPPMEIVFGGMEDLLHKIKAVAPTNSTVMLFGETGTGKGLISKVIHKLSERKGPLVEINCAAVPENLLESEFFGHEKGAFTGATSSKKGKFELATDGTIFLDEISEMHSTMQAKLLRILQDKTFERLGSNLTKKTNTRVICATNKDLNKEVSEGKFREDLYFRLCVFPLELKPLRERKSHIPALTKYLASNISVKIGKKIKSIPDKFDKNMEWLLSYNWPGNVRELQNYLERAIILSQGEEIDITKEHIAGPSAQDPYKGTLQDIEKRAIEDVLKRVGGSRKKTAETLGISQRSLQYKIKDYGVIA